MLIKYLLYAFGEKNANYKRNFSSILTYIWNKKETCTISPIQIIPKLQQQFTPIPGMKLISLGCDQNMSSVFEVIFHNNVGHYNGTCSKNHGESIQYQCFFWQTAIFFSASESNDKNTWTFCNMHITSSCAILWGTARLLHVTSQYEWCEDSLNRLLKWYHVFGLKYHYLYLHVPAQPLVPSFKAPLCLAELYMKL